MSESSVVSSWSVKESFPSVLGEGRPLIDRIIAEMEARGWSGRDVFAVHLALEEAFTNAIEHGNHCDPRKSFHVSCTIAPQCDDPSHPLPPQVVIVIRDEGDGFNQDLLPDPCQEENIEMPSGRGVLLIHGFMTRVDYNEAGNEITMVKEPSPEEPSGEDSDDEDSDD